MALTVENRLAVHELLNLHGHLIDNGEFDRLDELFTEDVVYDVTAFGFGELRGIAAIRGAALALGERNPLGHHVTNIVVEEVREGVVRALSKGIGIQEDGSSGTVSYDDTVQRTDAGWRITRRRVLPRKKPLQP